MAVSRRTGGSSRPETSRRPSTSPRQGGSARPPLDRGQILAAAVALADVQGLAALTMRRLGVELGVEAMSLYHHVRGKEDLLDGMVDVIFGEIDLPEPGGDWRAELRRRSTSARAAMLRHPWAVPVMESRRTPGVATLRQHDAVLGTMRLNGFTISAAAHAFSLLDAYVYGFAVQEASLPFESDGDAAAVAGPMMEAFEQGAYPHLVELAVQHVMQPGYRYADEFEIGLELVLDALDTLRERGLRAIPPVP